MAKPFRTYLTRHAYGRFSHKITEAISNGIHIEEGGRLLYVIPIALEAGDNAFIEEIRLMFRLEESQPTVEPSWLIQSEPSPEENEINNTKEDDETLWFTFSSELSVSDNLNDFNHFLSVHIHPRGEPNI
ncbi:hypothetical protein [Marinigracilibium pacificum]|uniref:Uncharacterized protein n=1 Tax=Marinigracilibium pacificum TaxID=2729599 RepID=A0A848J8X2_9BACT|nr:hypothetical protein [Marinigracilibium pacificum]NMM50829.1 hypothetical protein [Marinigracilibium pacificum]